MCQDGSLLKNGSNNKRHIAKGSSQIILLWVERQRERGCRILLNQGGVRMTENKLENNQLQEQNLEEVVGGRGVVRTDDG